MLVIRLLPIVHHVPILTYAWDATPHTSSLHRLYAHCVAYLTAKYVLLKQNVRVAEEDTMSLLLTQLPQTA